jgi:2-haloacid dehalogenase
MPVSRREFLNRVAGGVATGVLRSTPMSQAATGPKIKALAFDAFPIFDPRPVFALVEQLFPGQGADLSHAWRVRQFEYQWLRALSGRDADFWQTTEDAFGLAANMRQLDLTPDKRTQLMDADLELKAWPEVRLARPSLRSAGIRLAFLSHATPQLLEAGIKNSRLEGIFEHVLSTDQSKTDKPDPRAYQMAIDAFGLTREDMAFVAFAGWEVAGAKWFGYTPFWANRLHLPVEELGVAPDAIGGKLDDGVRFVKASAGERVAGHSR